MKKQTVEPAFVMTDNLTFLVQHPDFSRLIRIRLTPNKAYELAERLIEQADRYEGELEIPVTAGTH